MRSEISHTSHSIALDFYIRAEHLANQRFQSSERYNEQLVLGYLLAESIFRLTINSKIAQSSTGGPLHLVVVACQEIQHWVQSISSNFSYFLFCNLGKSQSGGPLQVDVIRKGQGGQSGQGRSGEKVGVASV